MTRAAKFHTCFGGMPNSVVAPLGFTVKGPRLQCQACSLKNQDCKRALRTPEARVPPMSSGKRVEQVANSRVNAFPGKIIRIMLRTSSQIKTYPPFVCGFKVKHC